MSTSTKTSCDSPGVTPIVKQVAALCPWADEIIACTLDEGAQVGIACKVGEQQNQWRYAVRFFVDTPKLPTANQIAEKLHEAYLDRDRRGVWSDDRLEGNEEPIDATA